MPTRPWTRRDFLRLLLSAGAGAVTGCARDQSDPTVTAPLPTSTPPPPSPTAPPTPSVTPTAAPSATATALPAPTATPAPADRIQNVIIFVQENHTFDSLFAAFPGADGEFAGQTCPDALPADPPHQHADALALGGATTAAARCSYTEALAPVYWKVARAFTLCDRYFSEVRGPSHPNYFMLTSAQSPIINTPSPTDVCPDFCFDLPTLAHRLDDKGLTWRDYGGILTDIAGLVGRSEVMDRQDDEFFVDAAAGTLPSVSWLNSAFLEDGYAKSGHPPASLCSGENYAVRVLTAAMSSPQWATTALFLVWDCWGGFWDHVEPPVVETWSDGTPFRYGHRVPCLVLSPYARAGYVSHELHSHVSLLHFAETVFALEPLTERDAAASTMLDCFDFNQPALAPLALEPRACPG
jgi:phospholipase C